MKIKSRIMSTLFVISLLFSLFGITVMSDALADDSGGSAPCGDVNGDMSVDEADAIYLLRHTLMPEKYPISGSADFDGSEMEDIDDVIRILNHLSNPDEYPLIDENHLHALEHFEAVDASCKAEGNVEYWYCTLCKNMYSDSGEKMDVTDITLPILPHTEEIDSGIEPMIGVPGLTEGSHCSICGVIIRPQETIPALMGVILNCDQGVTVVGLEKSYTTGDTVFLTADIADGYTFDGWFVGDVLVSENFSYSFEMPDENVTLEARCHLVKYTVEIEADDGITISGLLDSYATGDVVSITANLDEGLIFDGWYLGGELVATDLTYTFKLEKSDLTLEARLNVPHYTVTVKEGVGFAVNGLKLSYVLGETVNIYATVDVGYKFLGWILNGAMISTDTKCTLDMSDESIILEPVCCKIYNLTAKANLEELGEITAPDTAYETETVTVIANANAGYEFIGWFAGDVLLSTDAQYTFVMPSADYDVTARFVPVPTSSNVWNGEIAQSFSGGSGTESDPYLISTGGELAYLAFLINENNGNIYYDKYYRLTDNINLGGNEWNPIGCYRYGNLSQSDSRAFGGHFDGAGYTISNFKITAPKSFHWYFGLFGLVRGSVENLGVCDFTIDINVSADAYVGGIAGKCEGRISRSYAEGIINVSTDSYASVGGLIGSLSYGTIDNAVSVVEIDATSYSDSAIGGLVGHNNGNIGTSYSASNISAISKNHEVRAGGLVGINEGDISDSLAVGNIDAMADLDAFVGGLVGYAKEGRIVNSYRYEDQKIVSTGREFARNTLGMSCTMAQLNGAELYEKSLDWSGEVWDYEHLDLARGIYPRLKGFISEGTSFDSIVVGESYYEIVVEETKGGKNDYILVSVILLREGDAFKLCYTPDDGYILLDWLLDGEKLDSSESIILTPKGSFTLTAVVEKEL